MISRPRLVRVGYAAVIVYIVLTALLIFLENTRFRSRFTDQGAPFCMISLFFIIPVAIITLWFVNRKFRKEHTRPQRALMHAAHAFFFVAWLFSCFPVVFFVGITQPWPLTLRHGPDTGYAREGFTTHAGFAPPSSVSRIYYRIDSGWLDVCYRLRFKVSDPAVVQRIVRHRKLAESEEQKMGLPFSRAPKWWKEKRGKRELKCYFRENPGGYYWYLWYEPESGTVWYEEFSV